MATVAGKGGFLKDKEELKPGLIIFRRADVQHCNWYCRVKVPNADRYKTFSLKTEDVTAARSKGWRHDANVEYSIERDIPLFNRSFAKVAQEFLAEQEKRAEHGEISAQRPKKLRAVIEGPLNDYMGSTQVHLIGDDTWKGYTAWRRTNGEGRAARNGVRPVSEALAAKLVDQELAMREKGRAARGLRPRPSGRIQPTRCDGQHGSYRGARRRHCRADQGHPANQRQHHSL